MIRIHRIVFRTRSEGPGLRLAVWTQGCRAACPGCYATALWDEQGGTAMSTAQLCREIVAADGIEGITLLGGEPFLQAAPLAEAAAFARERGLSVITFTGQLYEQLLTSKDNGVQALLRHTDVLIDGPYRQELRDFSRPLVGSANQRFLFLTGRYTPEDMAACRNSVELRIGKDGAMRLNGMGDFIRLQQILQQSKGEKTHGIL